MVNHEIFAFPPALTSSRAGVQSFEFSAGGVTAGVFGLGDQG